MGGDQVVFHLGFAVGDLCHEVVVLGLALLVLGPVGVAEMGRAVQRGSLKGRGPARASGGDRPVGAVAAGRRGSWEGPVGRVNGELDAGVGVHAHEATGTGMENADHLDAVVAGLGGQAMKERVDRRVL
ncbi:hypothetical protein AB0D14_32710 [Streptomyces sp. NPDC048484]|uniref:hypothetical protein n=1 Tax=Streptomyces sp. NPDC048484 TaxID=3155146 RepID=UPI00343D3F98